MRFRGEEEPPLQTTDENGTHDVVKLTDFDAFTWSGVYNKTTVKRYKNDNEKTKAYSYFEVTEIELLDGQSGSPESLPLNSNNSISDAKLLKNIEKSYDKGKKLLDESSSELEDSDVRF